MNPVRPLLARAAVAAALAATCLAAAPSPASAQFGKLKKAIEKKAGGGGDPSYAANVAPTEEITAPRLDSVLAGFRAQRAIMNGANGGKSHAALAAQLAELQKKDAALATQADKDREQYNKLNEKSESCRSEAFGKLNEQHQQAMQAHAMENVAKMQQVQMENAPALQEAMQRRDSAAIQRIQVKMMVAMGVDPKADTAAVDKQCGKTPAKPTALAQYDALREQEDAVSKQMRQIEDGARDAAVKESHIDRQRLYLICERVLMYNPKSGAYTKAEHDVLDAKQAEIKETQACQAY